MSGGTEGTQGGKTVGIVLVSHSAALAEGAAVVASQISGGIVAVIGAGGTEDGGIGTSIEKVRRALRLASSGAGVVIVPDLGSSVLTVRALLAEPDDETPEQVLLADAPFVEGAVAATVTAAAGGDVTAVLAAAEGARHARKL
jgi:phosphoenolpyruvate---glycerone phosphotransferase subunit DhaM